VSQPDRRHSTIGRLLSLVLCCGFVVALAAPAGPAEAEIKSTLTPAEVQAKEWWIERLNLKKTWKITRGAGVTVAVLDTGVEGGFGDLHGAMVPGFDTDGGSGAGTVDKNPERHGTRIADEIAGRGTGFGLLGVAPRAKILPVFIAQRATGDGLTDGTSIALDRLSSMAHPPQVVNMSYGTPLPCPASVQQAVTRAIGTGMILVASAGNSGDKDNAAEYPADCKGVVAAAAINYNGHVWSGGERKKYVALAGPGVHLIGYYPKAPGFGYGTGTSDAGAMVSATMALVRAKFPALSSRRVVARVLATARQFVGKPGTRNARDGFGVALPYQALTKKVPADAPNPIYDALGGTTPPSTTSPPTSPASSSAPSSGQPSGQSSSGQSAPAGPTSASSSDDRAGIPPASAAPAGVVGGSGGSGPDVGLIVAIAFGVIVVAFAVFLFLVRSRGRRGPATPPAGGPSAGTAR
jgi:hypothetical protein